jgi:hypothetical protein
LNLLNRFLKSKTIATPPTTTDEQAVLIYIEGEDLDGSIPVQEALIDLPEGSSEVGMFDGNEVGGGQLVLFLYGPDAELLFKHIEPVIRADEFCHRARVVIRWGKPGSPQREVNL